MAAQKKTARSVWLRAVRQRVGWRRMRPRRQLSEQASELIEALGPAFDPLVAHVLVGKHLLVELTRRVPPSSVGSPAMAVTTVSTTVPSGSSATASCRPAFSNSTSSRYSPRMMADSALELGVGHLEDGSLRRRERRPAGSGMLPRARAGTTPSAPRGRARPGTPRCGDAWRRRVMSRIEVGLGCGRRWCSWLRVLLRLGGRCRAAGRR